ncbi:glycosyl hydrolase, partial [Bacteroidia bacterium]|nr:glycosyl hydrolase [Bacteroidia bacterium]
SGVTFQPIFDGQKVYSIGCITIDENSGNLWVGTGENVGGRHISYGDGVYLSKDGGKSWVNMGLKSSEHISKIIVHPTNPNIVWVASQGPLWSSGGERGVYMTTDGGKKWKRTLGDSDWTGATDLLIDSRNPDVLYAATWQRHRTVASYLGGGPESGVYKSVNGGKDWKKLKSGLPGGNMGKIGLAISPQNPDLVYAAIELDLKKGGFYRSANKGASWVKMSDIVSGGTGPHYYQEIYASPHQLDRVYFANNYLKVTDNGGKSFQNVANTYKHVDNHTVVFRKSNPDYLMVGTDGGVYETFDLAKNWRHMSNLPITQFYKLAVDDAEPFYNIYGGTQDNNTQGGPSRTNSRAGISNADWKVVLGGDGHQPATEPGNPDIVYAQSQQGYFTRLDMASGQRVSIRPQPGKEDNFERYNWDAPILVSAHSRSRIYVASHRLWRSDDRGDTWIAMSGDLTRNEERFNLPIMGRKQSFNNSWDVYAMSTYNTITSIAESPKNENLMYIGTDDGLVQVTSDGGASWASIDTKKLPGAPERAYVNDIKADLFDENKVYLALDNHKNGDYKPYLYVSTNQGKSWKSIGGTLPENNYVWRIVQDHVKPELMFAGTEFGLFFTPNAGNTWKQLKGGLPTISFRDLAIQKRENDLVAASFGRSFYILDDYSFLRNVTEEMIEKEADILPMRDADLFLPKNDGRGKGGYLGAQNYVASNPEFGAVVTYYLRESQTTLASERSKKEKELNKSKSDVDFPGWEELLAEKNEVKEQHWLVIRDAESKLVRKVQVPSGKGFHRYAWDLRGENQMPVSKSAKPNGNKGSGFLVGPGKYLAQLYRILDGEAKILTDSLVFNVIPLYKETLPEKSKAEKEEFAKQYTSVSTKKSLLMYKYNETKNLVSAMEVSANRIGLPTDEIEIQLAQLQKEISAIDVSLKGNPLKNKVGEKNAPTLNERIWAAAGSLWGSTYGPTTTALQSLAIAEELLVDLEVKVNALEATSSKLYTELRNAGAPAIRGAE